MNSDMFKCRAPIKSLIFIPELVPSYSRRAGFIPASNLSHFQSWTTHTLVGAWRPISHLIRLEKTASSHSWTHCLPLCLAHFIQDRNERTAPWTCWVDLSEEDHVNQVRFRRIRRLGVGENKFCGVSMIMFQIKDYSRRPCCTSNLALLIVDHPQGDKGPNRLEWSKWPYNHKKGYVQHKFGDVCWCLQGCESKIMREMLGLTVLCKERNSSCEQSNPWRPGKPPSQQSKSDQVWGKLKSQWNSFFLMKINHHTCIVSLEIRTK